MSNPKPSPGDAANNMSFHVGGNGTATHASNDIGPTSGSAGSGNVSSLVINATMTAQPSTGDEGGPGLPGGVIALLLCLLVVGVAVLCIIFYLKRTGKLYKMIPFKPLINTRRSSISSSDRALHVEPVEPAETERSELGEQARHRETAMFTIEDHDMESVDIDSTSRGTNDEYFYDEVFGKSMFEDEVTNASMRELYLASDNAGDEDELDVDALVDSITREKPKAAKT